MTNEPRPRREVSEVAGEIRDLLADDPQWADFGEDTDRLVGELLEEERQHHVPRELLWEYTAERWSELYGPEDEELAGQ
jgi:hypothetical protein